MAKRHYSESVVLKKYFLKTQLLKTLVKDITQLALIVFH